MFETPSLEDRIFMHLQVLGIIATAVPEVQGFPVLLSLVDHGFCDLPGLGVTC